MTTNTTRRAVMAGIAAAPVAGLPRVTAEAAAAVNGDEKPMTAEDYAAAEFEPWPADLLEECAPPDNEKWAELSLQTVPTIRCAWLMLGQPKEKIIAMLRDVDEKTGCEMFDAFRSAIDFHKQAVKILEAAECRILVAGSFLEVNEWEAQS
jgi:hypothetical protein